MKRVSIEQNFLPLYNQFVQAINHPLLDAHIKRETFRNIRVGSTVVTRSEDDKVWALEIIQYFQILLRSDKRQAASNYSDRQLLKNLGMWLGSITIARNKPILIHVSLLSPSLLRKHILAAIMLKLRRFLCSYISVTFQELDLKALLMEAYYKGQQELLFVVPFIAKILFSCGKTQVGEFERSCRQNHPFGSS